LFLGSACRHLVLAANLRLSKKKMRIPLKNPVPDLQIEQEKTMLERIEDIHGENMVRVSRYVSEEGYLCGDIVIAIESGEAILADCVLDKDGAIALANTLFKIATAKPPKI